MRRIITTICFTLAVFLIPASGHSHSMHDFGQWKDCYLIQYERVTGGYLQEGTWRCNLGDRQILVHVYKPSWKDNKGEMSMRFIPAGGWGYPNKRFEECDGHWGTGCTNSHGRKEKKEKKDNIKYEELLNQ